MDHHAGRITIIASSTMVHQRVRCMICGQPVDHRVVFMTNDARVLHAGCIPDHVRVPTTVLLQAIRRLERMVARARTGEDGGSERDDPATAAAADTRNPAGDPDDPDPGPTPPRPDPRTTPPRPGTGTGSPSP